MDENIELTQKEKDEVADDVTFKVKTSLYLKQQYQLLIDLKKELKSHCETSEKFRTDVKVLKTTVNIHSWVFRITGASVIMGFIGAILAHFITG